MDAGRLDADDERRRDLAVRVAAGDEGQHLRLARCQAESLRQALPVDPVTASGGARSSRARWASSSSSRSRGLRPDPSRDGVRLPERHARLRAGRAGGDERLGLAPAAVGRERRAFEPVPAPLRRPTTRSGRATPRARSYSASARASQPAAFGVTAEASAAARRATVTSFSRAVEPVADGVGVAAGAGERGQLRLCAQPLGAEPDAQLRGLGAARPRQAVIDGRVGVRPAALPERELCEVDVVDALPAVLAQRRERGLEVRPRGVEVAAADLEVGADA